MNEYILLGVTVTSTKSEVTKAYKKLAQIYHPDKSHDNGEKFKEIKIAYDKILKNLKNPAPKQPSTQQRDDDSIYTSWTETKNWSDYVHKPEEAVYIKVPVDFTELFGSTVNIPNTNYKVKVPYGILDGTRMYKVQCFTHSGVTAQFNLEFSLYDRTNFYYLKIVNGVKCLNCKMRITSGMAISGYEFNIKNINDKLSDVVVNASTKSMQVLEHYGLPGLGGSRGNLYIEWIIDVIALESERYDVIVALHKKTKSMLDMKTYNQHIK